MNKKMYNFFVWLLSVFLITFSFEPLAMSAAETHLVLADAFLIDGTGSKPMANTAIHIKGDRIVAVGHNIPVPENATIINLSGKTVMPGLIDAHVHMGAQVKIGDVAETTLGGGSRIIFGGQDFTDNYREARDTSLAYGVTTTRSAGDFLHDILKLRESTANGKVRGPRIVACGPSFQQAGGHPGATVYSNNPITLREAARTPSTPGEAKKMVADLTKEGVDYIKIIISDTLLSSKGRDSRYKLPWSIIEAIIEEAHRKDMLVATHVENAQDALKAVQAGSDDIEHIYLYGDGALPDYEEYDKVFALMEEKGTYLTPTMIVAATADAGFPPIEKIDLATLTVGNDLVKRAYDAGVKLAAGSDAGAPELPHGWGLYAEIVLMVNDQGIPPLDAIKAATMTNAELLGKSADIGSVTPGKLADLIIVSGNPLEDITSIANMEMVIQGGELVVDKR